MKQLKIGLLTLLALGVSLTLGPPIAVLGLEWSRPERIAGTPGLDWFPSISSARDGRIWMVWQSHRSGTSDLYAKAFDGSAWGPDLPVVTHSRQDATPVITLLNNGSLIVVWASDRTGNPDIFYKTGNGSQWSPDRQLTLTLEEDQVPAVLSSKDGSLWVVWQRMDRTKGTYDLYYRIHSKGSWSDEKSLTFDSKQDVMPSITQLTDGRVFVAWYSDRTGNPDIFYKYFDGRSWSADLRLTTSRDWERRPSIVQDRAGVIWVFWTRELSVTGNTFQWDLYYRFSTDGGVSWSVEASLFPNVASDEMGPYAAQMPDGRIWLVYQSDSIDENSEIILTTSSPIGGLGHDIAVTGLSSSPIAARVGEEIRLTVGLENLGNFIEKVEVDFYADSILAGSSQLTVLPGGEVSFTYTWIPSELSLGRRTLSVKAGPVPGETGVIDNSLLDGKVLVVAAGDVDRNGRVDIIDAMVLALAYGSRPGDPQWNPDTDLDGDKDVDIDDASLMAIWFSWSI